MLKVFEDVFKWRVEYAFNDAAGVCEGVRFAVRVQFSKTFAEQRGKEIGPGASPLRKLQTVVRNMINHRA